MTVIKNLGRRDNIDVINDFLCLSGKSVVDAGCGALTFTRLILEQGAHVLAIDPDSIQAEKNRQAEPIPHLQFVEAGAEAIPTADESVDGVFFAYSLHHVPAELYEPVFAELQRVIRPGGFLYVIEPIDSPLNSVMKLYHNEDAERAAAQAALHKLAVPMFETADEVVYHSFTQYESFEQYANHYADRSFNSLYSPEDVRNEKVRAEFEKHGHPDYRFEVPKQVMCLRGKKVARKIVIMAGRTFLRRKRPHGHTDYHSNKMTAIPQAQLQTVSFPDCEITRFSTSASRFVGRDIF